MKTKKHPSSFIAIILTMAAITAAVLTGCANKAAEQSTGNAENKPVPEEKTPYAYGMDLIAVMSEMVNSGDYLQFISSSPEIRAVAERLAEGDYENVRAVYHISTSGIESLAAVMEEEASIDSFSEELLTYMNHKAASFLTSHLNSQEGYAALAASSIYTAEKTFVCNELQKDCIYLYTFQNGYPITISFTVGENSAVHAVGTFVINETIRATPEEEIQTSIDELFRYLGCEIQPLEIPDASMTGQEPKPPKH